MSEPGPHLPDDPTALKAMVAAREAEIDRLHQLIKELQRHRFGRPAESLPVDPLLLGREEAEQIEAEGLARIAEPCRVEGEIRGRSPDERRAVRQHRSRPLVAAPEPWLTAKLGPIRQKSKLAEAIRYALGRWTGLSRFLDDGRLDIDNTMVERAIRPLALTRKNVLFAGSDGGAMHGAVVASPVETCKLNRLLLTLRGRRRIDSGW